ncbi:MAG: hypothetical protein AAB961_00900 [Patescibacteria group bacterium]
MPAKVYKEGDPTSQLVHYHRRHAEELDAKLKTEENEWERLDMANALAAPSAEEAAFENIAREHLNEIITSLSPQEQRLVQLLMGTVSLDQVAGELDIRAHAVLNRVETVRRKLKAFTRVAGIDDLLQGRE